MREVIAFLLLAFIWLMLTYALGELLFLMREDRDEEE